MRAPHLVTPDNVALLDATREIFSEYVQSLGVDLSFQSFKEELNSLPGKYQEPEGALLLLLIDGEVVGCGAVRPLGADSGYQRACEMKRLYVRPKYRGGGYGRVLAEALLTKAKQRGYAVILLDTLVSMTAARKMYELLGFKEIPPYYANPLPDTRYLMAKLDS